MSCVEAVMKMQRGDILGALFNMLKLCMNISTSEANADLSSSRPGVHDADCGVGR